MKYRILFRGDSRPPSDIFASGFNRANAKGSIKMVQNSPQGVPFPLAKSGVCASGRLRVAAYFPFSFPTPGNEHSRTDHTYIYCVAVPTARIFNTHKRQILAGFDLLTQNISPDLAMCMFYAHEYATTHILPTEIVCAIKCERNWFNALPEAGCQYRLTYPIQKNFQTHAPREIRDTAWKFCTNEALNHNVNTPPLRQLIPGVTLNAYRLGDDCYHPSTKT